MAPLLWKEFLEFPPWGSRAATLCSSEDVSSQTDGTLGDNTHRSNRMLQPIMPCLLDYCTCACSPGVCVCEAAHSSSMFSSIFPVSMLIPVDVFSCVADLPPPLCLHSWMQSETFGIPSPEKLSSLVWLLHKNLPPCVLWSVGTCNPVNSRNLCSPWNICCNVAFSCFSSNFGWIKAIECWHSSRFNSSLVYLTIKGDQVSPDEAIILEPESST